MKKILSSIVFCAVLVVISSAAWAGIYSGVTTNAHTLGAGQMALEASYASINIPEQDTTGKTITYVYQTAGGRVTFGLTDNIDLYIGGGVPVGKDVKQNPNVNIFTISGGGKIGLLYESRRNPAMALVFDYNSWNRTIKTSTVDNIYSEWDGSLLVLISQTFGNMVPYGGVGAHLRGVYAKNNLTGQTYSGNETNANLVAMGGLELVLTDNLTLLGEYNYAAIAQDFSLTTLAASLKLRL